jgi:hypothetical protein
VDVKEFGEKTPPYFTWWQCIQATGMAPFHSLGSAFIRDFVSKCNHQINYFSSRQRSAWPILASRVGCSTTLALELHAILQAAVLPHKKSLLAPC